MQRHPAKEQHVKMTKREEDVMNLLVQGMTNKKIGKAFGISDHTVRDHVSSLLKKHNAMNRVELVARYTSRTLSTVVLDEPVVAKSSSFPLQV